MDEQENMKEQQSVAAEIMQLWDECPEDGEPTYFQLMEIYSQAYRLAELVQSLHEFKNNRNPPTNMRSIKVYFSNGDHLFTNINGTNDHILAYYIGKEFNLGNGEHDLMAIATKVEFLD